VTKTVRQIRNIHGFTSQQKRLVITNVVLETGEMVGALRITHELTTLEARYERGHAELIAVLCPYCGTPVRIDWRQIEVKSPVVYADLPEDHGCGASLPKRRLSVA
jgi:hypothetical protein